jgi:hypothetical protein
MKETAVIQSRKLLAAALALGLLAVTAACGGDDATATPPVSSVATAAPVPTSASVPIASPVPAETPGGVTQTSQTPTPSLKEVLEEVDRLLEGGSLKSPDFIESALGDLELPDLDVAIPAGAVSGLDADFDWQFEVPEAGIEPPAISPGDLIP